MSGIMQIIDRLGWYRVELSRLPKGEHCAAIVELRTRWKAESIALKAELEDMLCELARQEHERRIANRSNPMSFVTA